MCVSQLPTKIPGADGSHSERLRSLLSSCLVVDASARITAAAACTHPFFITSFVSDYAEGNVVVTEARKRSALMKFIDACRCAGCY